jgi:hypothetical protein
VHAEPLGDDAPRYSSGAKVNGVLLVHHGLDGGGCAALGITRETYFMLPESSWEDRQEAKVDNPNPRDQAAYDKATAKLATEVPKLVRALWLAGADQGDVETQLLDAARALILEEARAPTAAQPDARTSKK